MFFVVFMPALAKNVVIPAEWIYDIGHHLEKFVNNGLNSNQWFLCYYTSDESAFNDEHQPDKRFIPDFTLDLITSVKVGEEFSGVFFGLLVHFNRMYYIIHYKRKTHICYSFQNSCIDIFVILFRKL